MSRGVSAKMPEGLTEERLNLVASYMGVVAGEHSAGPVGAGTGGSAETQRATGDVMPSVPAQTHRRGRTHDLARDGAGRAESFKHRIPLWEALAPEVRAEYAHRARWAILSVLLSVVAAHLVTHL